MAYTVLIKTLLSALLAFFSMLHHPPYVDSAFVEEAIALLKWKASFLNQNNSLFSSWTFSNGTNSSTPCNWYGISCNIGGRVIGLNLTSSSLRGTLYDFPFSSLSILAHVNLSNNELYGTIPQQIGSLSNLIYLDLSSNQFTGKIPAELGRLTHLKSLYLHQNLLNGSIPQEIGQLSSLNVLALYNNNFSGFIPSSLGNLSKLVLLNLNQNQLSGSIPGQLGNLISLVVLELGKNQLNGSIEASFGGVTTICNISTLEVINLSTNQFSGRIPLCLGDLHKLQVIDLANNNIHGPIPSSLGSLTSLRCVHLQHNSLYGKLPLSLQNWRDLKMLDLGNNFFTDFIHPWIGEKLLNLTFLRLQSNRFYGTIPQQICQLQALQVLNLAQNDITGKIPGCFSNFSSMAVTHKAKGRVIYTYLQNIEIYFGGRELIYTKTTSMLTYIDLSDNNIYGEIPKELMILSGLRILNASKNHLNGLIPENIGNLKQLESLDLSGNSLSGPIPPSLATLNFLSHLNLSFNNLSGPVPRGSQLQTFNDQSIYMGNGQLCGPPSLKGCSDEKLSGADEYIGGKEDGQDLDFCWLYIGMWHGWLVGILGVCCILHFNESWRYAYFQFIENAYYKIHVAIAVKARACASGKSCKSIYGK